MATINSNIMSAKYLYGISETEVQQYSWETLASDVYFTDKTNLEDKVNNLETRASNLETAITTLKKSVSDGKTKVATAITNKGVATANDASFDTITNNINNIITGLQTNRMTSYSGRGQGTILYATAPYNGVAIISMGGTIGSMITRTVYIAKNGSVINSKAEQADDYSPYCMQTLISVNAGDVITCVTTSEGSCGGAIVTFVGTMTVTSTYNVMR